ncbi:MAG: serine hydrolase domain-containing protein [Planctomycetota bacterium]
MIAKLICAGLLGLATVSCAVSPPTTVTPLPLEIEQEIDAVFAKWDRADSPGMTVGVVQDGEFLYLRGFGSADLAKRTPNSAHTVFRIASSSKQFTAACIAMLIEEGKLSMETPLGEVLPELASWSQGVEIRHLVFHTSGIPDYLDLHQEDFFTPAQSFALLCKQGRPRFTPGSQFEYSNSNYFLLAEIITRVSGIPFPQFAKQEIFDPLGMKQSHFHFDPNHVVENVAHGYGKERFRGWVNWDTPLAHVGDGGLFTTVLDLAKWQENFRSLKVGNASWLRRMLTPSLEDYAFGLSVEEGTSLGTMIWHGGSWSGFNSELLRFPDYHLSVIVLSNSDYADASSLALEVSGALTEFMLASAVGQE